MSNTQEVSFVAFDGINTSRRNTSILGLDVERPQIEDFSTYIEQIIALFDSIDFDDNPPSLNFFGSYTRHAHRPNSDIDCLLIFPQNFIIDKVQLELIALEIARIRLLFPSIKLSIEISDIASMKSGTFNSFGPTFEKHFAHPSIIAFGEDLRSEFRYTDESDQVTRLRYNFSRARKNLFNSYFYMLDDYKTFVGCLFDCVDWTLRAAGQFQFLFDGDVPGPKSTIPSWIKSNDVIEDLLFLQSLFPNVGNPLLDQISTDPEQALSVMIRAVSCFEKMVKLYEEIKP